MVGFVLCLGRRVVEDISLFSVAEVSPLPKAMCRPFHGITIGGHTAFAMSDNRRTSSADIKVFVTEILGSK
jgi:hypothetical protein